MNNTLWFCPNCEHETMGPQWKLNAMGVAIIASLRDSPPVCGCGDEMIPSAGNHLPTAPLYEIYTVSAYASRAAFYYLLDDTFLSLAHAEPHDSLSGNDVVTTFSGLTIKEAETRINAMNNDRPDHEYDGCHACTWSIRMRPVEKQEEI